MRNISRGISAIELMIVLSILAILFGVAIPSISGAFEAARSGSAQTALVGSYMAAVSNATNSGTHAVLCPSNDGANCLAADPDWSGGWIAFLDVDGDREHQPGEPVVSQHGALEGKVHLRSTVGRTRIVIQPSGSNAGSNVTYTICDGRGATKAETLVLNNHGFLHAGVPTAAAIAATCAR